MLHILLGFFKIVGIILAVIIGLILLIMFVLLFAALRYELKASTDGEIKNLEADVRFSWLFHLVSGFVSYKEQKLDWQLRIAWKKMNVPAKEEPVPEIQKEVKETDNVVQEVKESCTETADVPLANEPKKSEKAVENKPKKKSKKKSKKKKQSIGEKIQCSFQKISDKIKEIKEWKDKIAAFIQAESHKKAFQRLLKELLRLLKKFKPKKLRGNVEFGFEDPYTTGSILAYASILYPFYGDNISIRPNFEEGVLKGNVYLKGRFGISYMVNLGLRLILDKNVRLTIKDIMKLIAKK